MKPLYKKLALYYFLGWVIVATAWQIFHGPADMNTNSGQILKYPHWPHIFGTDALGRDLLARTLEGGFVSLGISFVSSALSLLVAIGIGVLWTWFRPRSTVPLLIIDLLQALPSFVIATLVYLMIQGMFQSHLGNLAALVISLVITHWMNPARILRAQALQLLVSPFIEAARALGANSWHILRVHSPSHLKNSLLVLWTLQLPVMLMYESFLSFIGFGVAPPYTSWGLLLQEGWRYLADYPHLLLAPGIVLFTVLMSINVLLDSLRYPAVESGKMEPPKADSRTMATEIGR